MELGDTRGSCRCVGATQAGVAVWLLAVPSSSSYSSKRHMRFHAFGLSEERVYSMASGQIQETKPTKLERKTWLRG